MLIKGTFKNAQNAKHLFKKTLAVITWNVKNVILNFAEFANRNTIKYTIKNWIACLDVIYFNLNLGPGS
jgi:hypothetical protein